MICRIIITLLGLILMVSVQGQNLVPNPSFEEYIECPGSAGGLLNAMDSTMILGWYSMNVTPDFMHSCSDHYSNSVPNNAWGNQYPNSGEGYVSIVTYNQVENDAKEVIPIELETPLQIGESYYVSFYASDADGGTLEPQDCASNNLGLRFFVNPGYYWVDMVENLPLLSDNNSDVYDSEILTDSLDWRNIQGWFYADSAYTHLSIGNFFSNEFTLYSGNGNLPNLVSIAYIDDVCVSLDSSDCNLTTSMREQELKLELFYNPSTASISVNEDEPFTYQIISATGRLLEEGEGRNEIHVADLPNGIYVVRLKMRRGVVSERVLKY